MQTKADELKTQIAKLNLDIATSSGILARRQNAVRIWTEYIARVEAEKRKLEAQLEREDTLLIKPEGPCVTLEAHDGVEWKV